MRPSRAVAGNWAILVILSSCPVAYTSPQRAAPKGCKNIPGDAGWPSVREWDQLNTTVDGRLIKTIPVGSSCYNKTYDVAESKISIDTYDETSCATVQKNWHEPLFHTESSSSIMQTYFTNNSCNPLSVHGICGIGSYVQYAIDVRKDQDVIAGIKFAQLHNIRLLVRNTGHDYLGKSTGYGALALWTHHLKAMSPEIIQYDSPYYRGPALQVGAGVQVSEVYTELERQGHTAIGGECPSVGLAGGYIFAGGHSPSTSLLGLAADGILEMEGILANSSSFTATPTRNQDLYWFLSGSGAGGTVAFMKSVTFRVFEDFSVSSAIFTMPYQDILTDDEFWTLIDTWHALTPEITAAGAYAYAFYQRGYFQIWPLFAPKLTTSQTIALIQPFIYQVDALRKVHPSLSYNLTSSTHPTFLSAFNASFPPFTSGTLQWSSRLIPRRIIDSQPLALSRTFRRIFSDGATMVEAVMNPNLAVSKPVAPNSVLPAWRTAVIDLIAGKPYNDTAPFAQMRADREFITRRWTSALAELAPVSEGGGAYMNEADAEDPDWRESFYGFYERQVAIKTRYDPNGLWYAKTAVGSEMWAEDEEQRLCRT